MSNQLGSRRCNRLIANEKRDFTCFRGTAIFATLVFLWFFYVMSMVPGVPSADKLWMLSITSALMALPLSLGTWRFRTTDAPAAIWPFGTAAVVLLGLEFMICIITIIEVARDIWIQ